MGTYETRLREAIYYFGTPITFLLDGTEQEIHSTKHIFHETNYYSKKKKQHSITVLLIMSPVGRILFISICYYGSVVDNELVVRTRAYWAPLLTNGEATVSFTDKTFVKIYVRHLASTFNSYHVRPAVSGQFALMELNGSSKSEVGKGVQ